jgi:hypothetical protein
MITATVSYKLPPHIDHAACRAHFHRIAPGSCDVKGLVSKHFIWSESGWAGGVYQWETLEDAKAFYGSSRSQIMRAARSTSSRRPRCDDATVASGERGPTGSSRGHAATRGPSGPAHVLSGEHCRRVARKAASRAVFHGGYALAWPRPAAEDQRPSALRALVALPPTVRTTTAEPRPAVVA